MELDIYLSARGVGGKADCIMFMLRNSFGLLPPNDFKGLWPLIVHVPFRCLCG